MMSDFQKYKAKKVKENPEFWRGFSIRYEAFKLDVILKQALEKEVKMTVEVEKLIWYVCKRCGENIFDDISSMATSLDDKIFHAVFYCEKCNIDDFVVVEIEKPSIAGVFWQVSALEAKKALEKKLLSLATRKEGPGNSPTCYDLGPDFAFTLVALEE